MSQEQSLSKAEVLAAMVGDGLQMRTAGQMVPITVRVPIWVAAKADAVAKQLGRSRAFAVSYVLDVGLEELYQRLDQPTVERLSVLEAEAFDLLNRGETTSGDL